MQLTFLWGTVFVALLATFSAMNALAATGGAYSALIQTLLFVLRLVTEQGMTAEQIPATLASTEALLQTILTGLFTWQAAVIALTIGVFVFIGAAAFAYTKALVLGVVDNATVGKKTTIVDMFRAGRKFWRPVFWYYVPFAAIIWLSLLILFPLITYMLGHIVATQGMQAELPLIFLLVVLLGAIFLLLRGSTIFADAIIVDGSRKPVRDSLRFSGSNVIQTIKVVGLLVLVAIVLFIVNEGLSFIERQQIVFISALAAIFGLVLYAFWRLWVAAFVVAVWRSGNLKRRMPRAS